MPTPDQYRRALERVTKRAVADAIRVARSTNTAGLIDAVPALIAYYSDGSAALAADQYDELREAAQPRKAYAASLVVNLRDEKIRRGLLWAAGPMYGDYPDVTMGEQRLADVVQLETARPFRDTTLTNTKRDPASVGWRRNTSADECRLCRMLAGRGAVYKESTARFATHPNCSCTASPAFDDGEVTEASVLQYVASQRRKSPSQRAALNAYLASMPG